MEQKCRATDFAMALLTFFYSCCRKIQKWYCSHQYSPDSQNMNIHAIFNYCMCKYVFLNFQNLVAIPCTMLYILWNFLEQKKPLLQHVIYLVDQVCPHCTKCFSAEHNCFVHNEERVMTPTVILYDPHNHQLTYTYNYTYRNIPKVMPSFPFQFLIIFPNIPDRKHCDIPKHFHYRIRHSHGGEYKDCDLLGCDTA
jgi:hypothetical protein